MARRQWGLERSELLQREQELSVLDDAVMGARGGVGGLVVVQGEAGVGKSALLEASAESAAAHGLAILAARGAELECEFAFGVAVQLFEAPLAAAAADERTDLLSGAAGAAAGLFEGRLFGSGGEDSFALVHGLYWLAANVAERAPTLIVVDDAHWADRPTLRFLLYLAQRLADLPLALILAIRSGEPDAPRDLLDRLSAHPDAKRLQPAPLSEPAVESLVRARMRGAEPEFVGACWHVTGGNPFLLGELLTALTTERVSPTAASVERVHRLAPGPVLRQTLVRLARLPPDAGRLAKAAAILGDNSPLRHGAVLADLEHAAAARAADALAAARILRPGERLVFVHPLLRAALYDDTPVVERAQMHLHAARIQADEGVEPDELAGHLLAGAHTGEVWVVEQLRRAAELAIARGAPESAARYLRRALDEPPTLAQRARVLVELGEAEALAAQPRAIDRLQTALTLVEDPRERARTALRLSWMVHRSGRPGDAADLAERALRDLGDRDRQLADELTVSYLSGALVDHRRASTARRRLERLLARSSESATGHSAGLLSGLAGMHIFHGGAASEVVSLAKAVLRDGALIEQEGSDSMTVWHAISCLSWSDELEAAERMCDLALADARRRGSPVTAALALYERAWPRYWMGRIGEATADAQAAVDAWSGGWGMYLPAAVHWLALCDLERDDLDAAAHAVDRVEDEQQLAQSGGAYLLLLGARARVAMSRGDYEQALETLLSAGEQMRAATSNPGIWSWRSDAAIAAARLGDLDQARELANDELHDARRFGAARPIGIALRAAGLVESGERAVALLREAVAVLERSPAALERARALIDLGGALRRDNRRVDARQPLRRGMELAQRFEALALERRAHDELEATGARPRRRQLSGLAALTPSERRVAELAADGMTNRQIAQQLFVTVKAVQFHLGNVYRKLDTTREQLAITLGRHRLHPPGGGEDEPAVGRGGGDGGKQHAAERSPEGRR